MTTNYKPIPISQPPEKEGVYICLNKKGSAVSTNYSKEHGFFDTDGVGAFPIRDDYFLFWLLPVPDSIILTREELGAVWDAGYKRALGTEHMNKGEYINNLLNKQ